MLFIGYQAEGTPAHAIQTYGPKTGNVDLDGERINIRVGITSIGGYSAHADQKGLVEFVTGILRWPTEIRVVHGEDRAKRALADILDALCREQKETGASALTAWAIRNDLRLLLLCLGKL